ncbi:MAG: restriction endonuclease subunit S [Ruminococcus sp.]|nr:restriction endonuclease subunit S [Ruminococcus sp.]
MFLYFTIVWEQREVKDICEQITETITPLDNPDEIFTEYSMPAFDNSETADIVVGKSMNSMRKVIDKPCILVNKLNVRKKRIWNVTKPEFNAVCSAEFVPLSSSRSNLTFIKYILLTDKFTSYLEDCSSGSSNSQKRVTPDVIMSAKIIVPKIEEQNRIGEFFTNLDNLITLHQRKLNTAISRQNRR